MEQAGELATPEALRCQVCGEDVPPEAAIGCTRCGAPYHTDCFHYYGKCAIFGCETTTTQAFTLLPPVVQKQSMHITEGTAPSFSVAPYLEGAKRKFLTRAKDLPMTIGAGLVGSVLTMGGFLFFVDNSHHPTLWLGLLFCGLGPGLLAPFIAPSQHRHPVAASTISGVLFFLFYTLRFGSARFFWSTMTVAAGIFFATSLAEAVLGKLTPAGQALGRLASPLRHIASWAFFLGAILLGAKLNGEHLSQLAYQEITVLSVLSLVAAVPALEMGKEEFRRHELGEERRSRLPSQGPAPTPQFE